MLGLFLQFLSELNNIFHVKVLKKRFTFNVKLIDKKNIEALDLTQKKYFYGFDVEMYSTVKISIIQKKINFHQEIDPKHHGGTLVTLCIQTLKLIEANEVRE